MMDKSIFSEAYLRKIKMFLLKAGPLEHLKKMCSDNGHKSFNWFRTESRKFGRFNGKYWI